MKDFLRKEHYCYSIFALKQSKKTKGFSNRTLVLSLGVTIPPVTPVTELDLGFFFIRMFPSLYPLYTFFIITITYYYQLYIVKFTPWKRQNELCNYFVQGHPSSIKFIIDLASHVFHSLLRTMFRVFVIYSLPPV